MKLSEKIIGRMAHYLRRQETVYRTAKETGLRADVIKNLEAEPLRGTAASMCLYIDSFAERYQTEATLIFRDAYRDLAQGRITFGDDE